tara:strand:+ start:46 stop:330 length:285 start_codon:yes stop_codon:yes gene_type:complete
MNVMNLYTCLPGYLEKKVWDSNPFNDSTYILAIWSVGQVVFSPFNSKLKNKIGAKNQILIGLFLVGITSLVLGLLSLVEDGTNFYIAAMFLRFF